MTHDELKDAALRRQDVRAAYEALAPEFAQMLGHCLSGQISREEAIEEIGIDWVDLAERQQRAVLEDMEWALTQ